MTAQVLDGEVAAAAIRAEVAERVATLRANGHVPGLGTVLVGDDGPSAKYVAMKHADCTEVGIESHHEHLPATATQDDVLAAIGRFNDAPEVDAYLVQHPFPSGLDFEGALRAVDPSKDVDGLHPTNLGLLVQGVEAPVACTPAGIVALLDHHGISLEGRHVVVVGRGVTIGRPIANLLTLKRPGLNAVVTVVHTGAGDLARYTREADVIVAAAGSPQMITTDMVRPGAVVVAAGVTFEDGRAVSDVDDGVAEVASWLSPRIGGVGPMTRALLLRNCIDAAERRATA
jgi:methylenetetrahydrofolate dehydrogenase (NADP+)/methenyltetrahydrofolate cyclohydrolase